MLGLQIDLAGEGKQLQPKPSVPGRHWLLRASRPEQNCLSIADPGKTLGNVVK